MVGVRTSELAAIFLATFENIRGTVISRQFPEDYVSWAQFKEISNIVLPRAELAFRLITVDAFQHYIVGCPQRIEGGHYQRNTLQFNICLVIKPKPCSVLDDVIRWQFCSDPPVSGLRPPFQEAYEALALKINRYFHTLEEECAFLSTHLNKCTDDEEYTVISKCLESIFTQLHADGTCTLELDGCGSLYLRFSPGCLNASCNRIFFDSDDLVPDVLPNEDSSHWSNNATKVTHSLPCIPWIASQAIPQMESEVSDECVFVLIDTLYPYNLGQPKTSSVNWKTMDFVGDRILPYLDGYHCLPELAHLAGIDLTVARLYLHNLVRIGVVRALPAPTFLVPVSLSGGSTYFPIAVPGWLGLPRLATLLTDRRLAEACLDAIHCQSLYTSGSEVRCSLLDAFRVYTILCGSPNFSLPHLLSATPFLRFIEVSYDVELLSSSSNPHDSTYTVPSISLLRLVQFGEVNSLIHRLKCYPISDIASCVEHSSSHHPNLPDVDYTSSDSIPSRTPKPLLTDLTLHSTPNKSSKFAHVWTTSDDELWNEIRSSTLDGLHSMDAVGCKLSLETGRISPSLSPFLATELLSNRLHGRSLFPSIESNVIDLVSSTIQAGCHKNVPATVSASFIDGDGIPHSLPSASHRANQRLSSIGKVGVSQASELNVPVVGSPSNPSKVPELYWLWR